MNQEKKTVETPIGIFWMTPDGILHSRLRTEYDPNDFESNKLTLDVMEKLSNGSKLRLIAEMSGLKFASKAIREYADGRMEKIIGAAAFITPNAFSKMVMNIFIAGSNNAYPVKFFSNYDDAYKWIKTIEING